MTTPADNNNPYNNYNEEALRAEQLRHAAEVLGIPESELSQKASVLEGTTALYIVGREGAVIVSDDRTHLYAPDTVAKNDHVAAFKEGQRGTYQARQIPGTPVRDEESTSSKAMAIFAAIVVLIIAGFILFFALGGDEDEDTIDTEPSPTETVTEPADDETGEVVDEEETTEPEPTETVTEEEPAPTDEETLPTEGPATNGEDEETDFDPSNATINLPSEFVEDEAAEVTGSGFLPNEEVQFSITEVDLGNTVADSDGNIDAEVTIEGPFASQDTTFFVNGAESGISLEEEVSLVGSMETNEN